MISKEKLMIITTVWLLLLAGTLAAAPKADLWPRWKAHDPGSSTEVDHSAWDRLLDKYLVTNHPSGINLLNYGGVNAEDRRRLESYLDSLQEIPVSQLNLQDRAYTSENIEALLEKGAREYINHSRAVSFQGKKLVLSGIYDWFQEDFDGSEEGVLRHLRRYAAPDLAGKLESFSGRIGYGYDWSLNE